MKKSVFMRSIYFMILTLFLVIFLFSVSELYTINHFKKQIQSIYESSVNYSFHYWANQFYMANKEIKSFIDLNYHHEYEILCKSVSEEEIEESSAEIQKGLRNISIINGNQIGFFVYVPERDIMISSIPGSDFLQGENLKELKEMIAGAEIKEIAAWKEVKIGDVFYFLHLYESDAGYSGCYISFDSILNNILQGTKGGKISILNMDNSLVYQLGDRSLQGSTFSYARAIKMINKKILVELPYESISNSGAYLLMVLFLAATAAILMITIALNYQNKSVFSPLRKLKEGMEKFSEGDTTVRLHGYSFNNEIMVLYDTFNHMAEQIVNLKIDVYEGKLKQQQIYTQFLRVQIQPHFYTNILNLIFNLASIKDFTGIQNLAKSMSGYFRYLLSLKGDFVALADELQCIHQYASVQKIRYQDNFQLGIDCDADEDEEKIPPLLIQTFVENSIKHNIMVRKVLMIHLKITKQKEDLLIEIEDNGLGFPADILNQLEHDEEIEENGEHIGICNIKNRLNILYGNHARILIRNLENGASVNIRIPSQYKEGQGRQ